MSNSPAANILFASDSLLSRILDCRLFRRRRPIFLFHGCKYEILNEIGECAYGRVYRCRDASNDAIVAVKQILLSDLDEGVPSAIIREVSFLKELNHQNIIRLLNVKGIDKTVNLIFEYLEVDLHDYIRNPAKYPMDTVIRKHFLQQILSAVEYCHSHNIIHRDLKPKNLLVNNGNKRIKLADFGLAREFGDPDLLLSQNVATNWYRAPELLLCFGEYSTAIDLWSVGCIFGEMVLGKTVFQSVVNRWSSELDAIFTVLGTPTEETWPGVNETCKNLRNFRQHKPKNLAEMFPSLEPDGVDLLSKLLCLNPNNRISAEAALKHPYFKEFNTLLLGNPQPYPASPTSATTPPTTTTTHLPPSPTTTTRPRPPPLPTIEEPPTIDEDPTPLITRPRRHPPIIIASPPPTTTAPTIVTPLPPPPPPPPITPPITTTTPPTTSSAQSSETMEKQ